MIYNQDEHLDLEYQVKHFLRCHSKDEDKADIRTEVWQAVFEPGPNPKWVATCGGNKVCVIDFKRGSVDHRYKAEVNTETFLALSWGTVFSGESSTSLIAVGGKRSIFFIIPKTFDEAEFIGNYNFDIKGRSCIYSLLFHPDPAQSELLFCAVKDVGVYILIINVEQKTFDAKKFISCDYEITRIAMTNQMLLVASDQGLRGWTSDIKTIENGDKPELYKYNLPEDPDNQDLTRKIVDSVEVLKDDLIACKYVLRGSIYIFRLKHPKNIIRKNVVTVFINYVLEWSETDEYYIEISAKYDVGLLTSGDDAGTILLYDINFIKAEENIHDQETQKISVSKKLQWPKVNDRYLAKSKKLDADRHKIIISKASIHPRGDYIIGVTNNNTVCIWGKK